MNTNLPAGHVIDHLGLIHQTEAWKKWREYDHDYVAKYDKYDCASMSALRCEWLERHLAHSELSLVGEGVVWDASLLDFGCGNGSFARSVAKLVRCVHGYDVVTDYIREGVTMVGDPFAEQRDIVTFYDSLEHVPDVHGVMERISGEVKPKLIVISVPWCHAQQLTSLQGYRHFRPDEHLWYFDDVSLCRLMAQHGYRMVSVGNPEDRLRKGQGYGGMPDGQGALVPANILTGVFSRV